MQLVSNDSNREDISESEPILPRTSILQKSEESSSSCEITAVGGECAIGDLQNLHLEESCHLVNTDQPQCRICLDNGGFYYLPCSVYFLFFFFCIFSLLSPF